jgi:hypothetical protein
MPRIEWDARGKFPRPGACHLQRVATRNNFNRTKTPKYSTNTIVSPSVNKGEVRPGTAIDHACSPLLVTLSQLIAGDGNVLNLDRGLAGRKATADFNGVILFVV